MNSGIAFTISDIRVTPSRIPGESLVQHSPEKEFLTMCCSRNTPPGATMPATIDATVSGMISDKWSRRGVLALFLSASATFCGCGAHPAPLQIEINFDITPADVKARIDTASQLANFVKKDDTFTLWATDHQTTKISTQRPATNKEAQALLSSISGKVIPITDLAHCFEKLADTAEEGELPLVAILYSDGLDDSTKPDEVAARISAAAERLAGAKRLRALILAGTVRDVRPGWTGLAEMLAPVGSKLTILPMATLNPDDIAHIVKQVRTKATP